MDNFLGMKVDVSYSMSRRCYSIGSYDCRRDQIPTRNRTVIINRHKLSIPNIGWRCDLAHNRIYKRTRRVAASTMEDGYVGRPKGGRECKVIDIEMRSLQSQLLVLTPWRTSLRLLPAVTNVWPLRSLKSKADSSKRKF